MRTAASSHIAASAVVSPNTPIGVYSSLQFLGIFIGGIIGG
jgi:hypothetical protein